MTGTVGLTTSNAASGDMVDEAHMNRKIENMIVSFRGGSVPFNQYGIVWDAIKAPWACDIVAATAWVRYMGGGSTSGGSVDIYENDDTVLTAPIALMSRVSQSGSIANASIAQNAEIRMKLWSFGGTLHGLHVAVTLAID